MLKTAILGLVAMLAACGATTQEGPHVKYDLSSDEKIVDAIQKAAGFKPYSAYACTRTPFEFPGILLVEELSAGPRGYFAGGVYVADRMNATAALATRGWAKADPATRGQIAVEWTSTALTDGLVVDSPKTDPPRITIGGDGAVTLRASEEKSSRIVNLIFGADGVVRRPTFDTSTEAKLRAAIREAAGIDEIDLDQNVRRPEGFPAVILISMLIHDHGFENVGYFVNGSFIDEVSDSAPALASSGWDKADSKKREKLALEWARIIYPSLEGGSVVRTEKDGTVSLKGRRELPRGMQQHAEPGFTDVHLVFGHKN